ncbi:hypothetical protein [Actinomadura rubrisoli]|uniref:Uncharacterized protein n=1 Tax=Actinomadura rubrisoli TaxID=2530368 RepID=A0A4R5B3M8_9ACTN|nr:hypothetical protein [Actinomadura rubrisoli]TDD77722.1 hypothetical protein E1298_29785 [Actinomadura rubrisoli]
MTWFKVDDSFYDHPKVFDLPDSAVALWTRAGCWSARNLTDGVVPARLPARLCDDHEAAVRALVDSGLWERTRGGYRFHDWDQYQPSKDEVTAERGKKSIGGRIGNHRRWHVDRGKFDPECVHCQREHVSDKRSDSDRTVREGGESEANRPVPTRPDPSRRDGGSVGESSSASRRPRENDDDPKTTTTREQTIDRLIVDVLADITGRTVDSGHAAKVRGQLLDGRQVANPMAYVAKALRERPTDFLPAQAPPAIRDAPFLDREPAPDQDQINARGRAAVEEARRAALAAKTAAQAEPEGAET